MAVPSLPNRHSHDQSSGPAVDKKAATVRKEMFRKEDMKKDLNNFSGGFAKQDRFLLARTAEDPYEVLIKKGLVSRSS